MSGAAEELPSCHKFHIHDVDELHNAFKNMYGKPSFDRMTEYLRLPYKTCWIDYRLGRFKALRPGQTEIRKRGLLVREDREIRDFPLLWLVIFNYFEGDWLLGPIVYRVRLNKQEPLDFEVPPNTKGEDLVFMPEPNQPRGRISAANVYGLSEGVCNKVIGEDITDLTTLNFFLLLLNCKNIEKRRVEPPKKLNKKRRKNKKPPLLSYYILKVSQPKGGLSSTGSPGGGPPKRIHFCRGHFKEYTADHPLFGKYTGLYWWQPHVRGDKERGVVLKDYEVKT